MSISNMKKLTVLTTRQLADPLVRRLIRLRCIEISTAEPDGSLWRYDCGDARIVAERRVERVEQVIPILTKYTERSAPLGNKLLKTDAEAFYKTGSYSTAWSVVDEVLQINADIEECNNEEARAMALRQTLLPWAGYDMPLNFTGTKNTSLILGVFPSEVDFMTVDNALSSVNAGVEAVTSDKSGFYAAIMFMREDEDAVNRILAGLGFVKSNFKEIEGTAKQELDRLAAEAPQYDIRQQRYIDRLRELAVLLDDIEVLYDAEQTALIATKNKQKLLTTKTCVLLEGWVPAEKSVKVAAVLDKVDCAYELADPSENDDPPVLLKNNGYATNFEWVVGMYSYPKYGSYDPTFIMSIFYFLIFGLMFADVGYGLLLLLGGFILPRVLNFGSGLKRTFNMFGYCGISSTILGAVFGGWFGDMPYAIMENMLGIANAKEAVPFFNGFWFNPLDDPMAFLIVSLAFGLVHLVVGMAVKFVLLCKEGKWLDAVFDIGSWWIIFGGIGVLLLVGPLPGWITVGVGIAMIVLMHGRAEKNIVMRFLKGLLGLYDITSYASDLLSYCRILALGLAAGVIAQVVNLIGTMGGASFTGFIVMLAVFLIGHGLNLSINILGSFVHTSRLQYLEFFNKFYEDGGVEFKPVEPSSRYSTVELDSDDECEYNKEEEYLPEPRDEDAAVSA